MRLLSLAALLLAGIVLFGADTASAHTNPHSVITETKEGISFVRCAETETAPCNVVRLVVDIQADGPPPLALKVDIVHCREGNTVASTTYGFFPSARAGVREILIYTTEKLEPDAHGCYLAKVKFIGDTQSLTTVMTATGVLLDVQLLSIPTDN